MRANLWWVCAGAGALMWAVPLLLLGPRRGLLLVAALVGALLLLAGLMVGVLLARVAWLSARQPLEVRRPARR